MDIRRNYIYFAVFSAGMTTLAIELSAARLLGSVFGVSNLVWASIIGLILIYLTAGYFLGGRWADRSPYPKTMFLLLAWGAFTSGLAPLVSRPVLRLAADAFDQLQVGVLLGSFLAVLILFSVPVTLLGTISPFAIRLSIHNAQEAGRVSGRVYALSTLGSFLGTFLPVLVVIPWLGTTLTFLAFSGFLLIVALAGLWITSGWRALIPWLWMPLVLLFFGLLWFGRPIKTSQGQIFETESAYNYIQVLELEGYRYLRMNEGQGIHSMYHPEQLVYNGPWMQFLAGPFFNPAPFTTGDVDSMAVVGLAAGTTARQAEAVFGPILIDGFEIDPAVIEVGVEYFGLSLENLQAVPVDGRWGLAHSPRRYSLIAMDAYRPPYIPWHLTTREFFEIARDHLKDDGVMVINVGRAPDDRRLIEGLVGTIRPLFASLHVMDLPGTFNSLIYATVQPTSPQNLAENYRLLQERGKAHPLLLAALERLAANLQPTPSSEVVFTDEHAPVEWITNDMILRFVLAGGTEELQ